MQRKRTELEYAIGSLAAFLRSPFGLPDFSIACIDNLVEQLRTLRRIQSIENWKREDQ